MARKSAWWQRQDAVRAAHEEIISRCCSILVDAEQAGRRVSTTYSGCLAVFKSTPYLLTAGHVTRELNALRNDPTWTINAARLLDRPHAFRSPANSVVFGLQTAHMASADYDHTASRITSGLDVGMVALTQPEFDAIRKNSSVGFFALDDANTFQPEGHYLLGMPAEKTVREGPFGHSAIRVSHDILPVRALRRAPKDLCSHPMSFYGTLTTRMVSGQSLKSIAGMSGGPIVGIRVEGERVVYRLCAIQTSWNCISNHIRGASTNQIYSYLNLAAESPADWAVLNEAKQRTCVRCPTR